MHFEIPLDSVLELVKLSSLESLTFDFNQITNFNATSKEISETLNNINIENITINLKNDPTYGNSFLRKSNCEIFIFLDQYHKKYIIESLIDEEFVSGNNPDEVLSSMLTLEDGYDIDHQTIKNIYLKAEKIASHMLRLCPELLPGGKTKGVN